MSGTRDKSWFEGLSLRDKARFLSSLADRLTIVGRDAYPSATPGISDAVRIARLQSVNELQHQIAQQIGRYLDDDPNRYPDEVFWDILAEGADAAGLTDRLQWAIQQAYIPPPSTAPSLPNHQVAITQS
jgi:hypothetical protein